VIPEREGNVESTDLFQDAVHHEFHNIIPVTKVSAIQYGEVHVMSPFLETEQHRIQKMIKCKQKKLAKTNEHIKSYNSNGLG
jgi:hypothetical protein